MSGLLEGTPIICRNCGGGMAMNPDASIVCHYCGARDVLPADELGRVLEIKNRLTLAERRAAQLKGFDATFAGVFERRGAFVRVMGVYVGLALFVLAISAYQLWSTILPSLDKFTPGMLLQVVLGQVMGPVLILGFGFSLGAALWTGRRHYRRRVRPLLLASRPAQPHAPFRCRACGGELPQARGADVTCRYCRSLNLVPAELSGSHAAELFQQAETAKQQLFRAHGALVSISKSMRTALVVGGVLTLLLGYGLPLVAMSLLQP